MRELAVTLLQHHIVKNATKIALFVGTLLNAINQGHEIVAGLEISWGQIVLNFCIPYCVASYSAAKNEIERNKLNASRQNGE